MKIKIYHFVFFFLFFFLLSYIIFKDSKKEKELNEFGKFTCGKVYDTDFIGKSHYLKYLYYIDNERYEGLIQIENRDKNLVGKFYLIRYSIKNPNLSEIILKKEITDYSIIKKSGFDG